jgi:hypothetical protein
MYMKTQHHISSLFINDKWMHLTGKAEAKILVGSSIRDNIKTEHK